MSFPTPINARNGSSTISSAANGVTSISHTAASIAEDVLHHDPPPGFVAAAAQAISKAPTVGEVRRGSFGQGGWTTDTGAGAIDDGARVRTPDHGWSSASQDHPKPKGTISEMELFTPLPENPRDSGEPDLDAIKTILPRTYPFGEDDATWGDRENSQSSDETTMKTIKAARHHSSGYMPPPKIPWSVTGRIALAAFWKFLTPFGAAVIIYGLNVVGWGGMLFLLLCGAAPAMCISPTPTQANQRHVSPATALGFPGPYYYNCNDINSPRRIWIEIDSQILNALFCVTGFGLAPWRFRDLYYLLLWRLTSEKKHGLERKVYGLRVLAGIHRAWFRLHGSETLDTLTTEQYLSTLGKADSGVILNQDCCEAQTSGSAKNDPRLPLPLTKTPVDPISSIRAPPTALWKLDFFIWCQVWNTFFQCCLCGFMWGENRYQRPPWSTGMFVGFACIIVAIGGFVSFKEGRKVKKVEGVAPSDASADSHVHDLELGTGSNRLDSIAAGSSQQDVVHGAAGPP